MQDRRVRGTAADDTDGMIEPVRPERHYDLVVRPPGPEEPACDCAGPPPEFLLPPPPVDPAWAAPDGDVCDVVAPYQVCRGLTEVPHGEDLRGTTSLSMLAALITTSLFLFIVLVAGTIFFCKHRRRLSSIMTSKGEGKRSDTSRMLYDDLAVRPHVMPHNLRTNGPHIEMVAVKGQCRQLMPGGPGGAGAMFVYPPPPSLTDDGSERMSNMYEEIPYYGRPAPSVSYCSDSDDDVSRPSDDDLRAERRRHAYIPVNSDDGGDVRYVRTMPAGAARPPAQPRRGQPRPKSADRRRQSPISPVWGPNRANPARRDESLQRKDPYYYSDLLERDRGDVGRPDSRGSPYGRPCDERRSPSQGLMYCQPDVAGVDLRSPSRGLRDGGDLRSPHDPGHVAPLASRMAADPFSDVYPGDRAVSHRSPRHRVTPFGGAGDGTLPESVAPDTARSYVSSPTGDVSGGDMDDEGSARYRSDRPWGH